MDENQIKINQMHERFAEIKAISSTLCTAKWLQCTLYLHNGYGHSCHHPESHQCDVEAIRKDPSSLHNTAFKKKQRLGLLEGTQVEECDYCWKIENQTKKHISDREYKSTNVLWGYPFLEKVVEAGSEMNIDPTYLEIVFDNTCNCKCIYCTPDISTAWHDDIKKHGPYRLSYDHGDLDYLECIGKINSPHKSTYLEAFWDWFPHLYKNLKYLRISGGEPLLNDNLWKIFNHIKKNPNPDLEFAVNSNLCVGNKLLGRLIKQVNNIRGSVKGFDLFTSCEAHGKHAEYIRYGMNYSKFIKNVNKFLSKTSRNTKVSFMVTFNVLSFFSFTKFLDEIRLLRIKHNDDSSYNRIPITISYLRWPSFLAVGLLPRKLREYYKNQFLQYTNQYNFITGEFSHGNLYHEEIDQIQRVCTFMESIEPTVIDRENFAIFVREFEKRHGLSFEKTFPELESLVKF